MIVKFIELFLFLLLLLKCFFLFQDICVLLRKMCSCKETRKTDFKKWHNLIKSLYVKFESFVLSICCTIKIIGSMLDEV